MNGILGLSASPEVRILRTLGQEYRQDFMQVHMLIACGRLCLAAAMCVSLGVGVYSLRSLSC